jgi:thiosulfate dehydrogenase [quinone] large subunit
MAMATTYIEKTKEGYPVVEFLPQPEPEAVTTVKASKIWEVLRLFMGWTFLWSFLDKAFALGFSTGRTETGTIDFFGPAAWVNGGSPTEGFLQFGTKGPFADFFAGLNPAWVDWVYMGSLLLIGLALIFGVGVRPAAVGGIIWMGMFYAASAIWPEHNPFLDEHVVYAVILGGIAYVGAGYWLGLGRFWARVPLVKKYPILK